MEETKLLSTLKTYLLAGLFIITPLTSHADDLKEDIYILASSSLSEDSLKQLVKDAEKKNLPVYFRGLIKNSYKETAAYFKKLGVGITIDPRPFREFNQPQVPAFVFKGKDKVLILKGNVPLQYALDKFKEQVPDLEAYLGKNRRVK